MEHYRIKIENFEGPLDLLLELIEKEKMDITRLSISNVADDYLDYVERRGTIELSNLSDFLLVASQLILLKSKALLPLFELTQEEEAEFDDLEQRLVEYQKFKKAAERLRLEFEKKRFSFSRSEDDLSFVSSAQIEIDPLMLRNLFTKTLQEIPQVKELEEEMVMEIITLEEKVRHLKESLEKRMKVAFHETVANASDKIEVVVTFLAMLEMIKQRIVRVHQDEIFGEIIIAKNNQHG